MASQEDARAAARRIVEQVLAEHADDRDAAPATVATMARPTAVGAADDDMAPLTATRPAVGRSGARTQHPDSLARQTARRIVEQVLADDQARRDALAAAEPASERGVAATGGVIDLTTTASDGGEQGPEPLADRLFAPPVEELLFSTGPPSSGLATVPVPVPDPGPDPGPDPLPDPLPDPGPFPSPDPLPDPDPFPPEPLPPDPEPAPQPLSGPDEDLDLTPARREAVDAARRIVQEVVAAHEQAERARKIEDEERRAQRGEPERQEPTPQTAEPQAIAEPDLDALPRPQLPAPTPSGPPPIPVAAQQLRDTSTLEQGPEAEEPAGDAAAVAVADAPTVPLSNEGGSEHPRTGRWLMTTVVGAVSLALLFPLAVRALRTLVTLG